MSHPPGYGHPGAPIPQPPKQSRAGWIVGGAMTAVLLVVAAVAVVVLTTDPGPGESAVHDTDPPSPSTAEPEADTPTEAVEGFVAAIRDHDLAGARAHLCEEPKDIPLPDEDEQDAFWDDVDAHYYHVGEENLLDDDEAMVYLIKKRDDARTTIIVDTIIEAGSWRMCDWYQDGV